METKRIGGAVILFVGLAIMAYALFSSFRIYTGSVLPPQIFQEQEEKITPRAGSALEEQLNQQVSDQLERILPTSSLPQMMNLASWSLFAGLLIFGGAQVSGIGIKLLKE